MCVRLYKGPLQCIWKVQTPVVGQETLFWGSSCSDFTVESNDVKMRLLGVGSSERAKNTG